jgi:hypothetical protein
VKDLEISAWTVATVATEFLRAVGSYFVTVVPGLPNFDFSFEAKRTTVERITCVGHCHFDLP